MHYYYTCFYGMLAFMNEPFILSAVQMQVRTDDPLSISQIWEKTLYLAYQQSDLQPSLVEEQFWGWDNIDLLNQTSLEGFLGDLLSGPGVHIQRGKDSSLQAALFASQVIQAGDRDLILAGGGKILPDDLEQGDAGILVLASPDLAGKRNLLPRGSIAAKALVSSSSLQMTDCLTLAAQQAIKKAGISFDQIELAAVSGIGLAATREWQRRMVDDSGQVDWMGKLIGDLPPTYTGVAGLVRLLEMLEQDHLEYGLFLSMLDPDTACAIILERL